MGGGRATKEGTPGGVKKKSSKPNTIEWEKKNCTKRGLSPWGGGGGERKFTGVGFRPTRDKGRQAMTRWKT